MAKPSRKGRGRGGGVHAWFTGSFYYQIFACSFGSLAVQQHKQSLLKIWAFLAVFLEILLSYSHVMRTLYVTKIPIPQTPLFLFSPYTISSKHRMGYKSTIALGRVWAAVLFCGIQKTGVPRLKKVRESKTSRLQRWRGVKGVALNFRAQTEGRVRRWGRGW